MQNTADSHDLLSEYVLVMLNNLKTMQDIHIQLVELVGEEPAHVLAAWWVVTVLWEEEEQQWS